MPPLPRGTVLVSNEYMGGNIARLLQRHRYIVDGMNKGACDFLCGGVAVVYVEDLSKLCDVSYRRVVSHRISLAKTQCGISGQRVVLLLLVDSMEPRPDILMWLNLHCSVELNSGVMLCWTEEECANYLEGLTESGVASVDYRMGRKKENAPMPALIEAFTQTPQLMARNDVVRAAHRFGSVAALLTATTEDLTSLPGFGPKKADRLHAVLHAGFHTSRRLVSDVIAETDAARGVDGNEGDPQRLEAREKMLYVLNQLRNHEMNESIDN